MTDAGFKREHREGMLSKTGGRSQKPDTEDLVVPGPESPSFCTPAEQPARLAGQDLTQAPGCHP